MTGQWWLGSDLYSLLWAIIEVTRDLSESDIVERGVAFNHVQIPYCKSKEE